MLILTLEKIKQIKEVFPFLQGFASENMPDMEGVLEPEDQERIDTLIAYDLNTVFPLNILNGKQGTSLADTLSELSSFCGEWFPDEGLDQEEIEDAQEMIELGEKLAIEIRLLCAEKTAC